LLAKLRKPLSGAGRWLRAHRWAVAGAAVALVAIAAVVYVAASDDGNGGDARQRAQEAPAPQVVVREVAAPESTEDLGFPAFATKNTTRVAGADATANAAAVALAVHPSAGGVAGPDAVTLVDDADWQAGIAAASLVAAPVSAPILVTTGGELGDLTEAAIGELDPRGSAATAGREAFVIGAAAKPGGLDTLEVDADGAAGLAAEVDRLRERLAGKPDHILVASADEPGYAMPAAAWAARSGDPVLFAERDSVPKATIKALRSHDGVPVYVLGPTEAISAKALKEIEHVAPGAERVGTEGEIENAIEFARYANGSFGWNINDPGHGLVLAGSDRPLDAAAAAPLSASGTWGPLLLTDDADALPAPLRGYLLDLKPGYADDPTRAVYNHVWLIGDTDELSVDLQAQVDELAEVAPVTSGSGSSSLGPVPGTPESQPEPNQNPSQPR
jgi:hypothetical protein